MSKEDRITQIVGIALVLFGVTLGLGLLFGLCTGLGWLLYTISIQAHLPFVLMIELCKNTVANWFATGLTTFVGLILIAGYIMSLVEQFTEPKMNGVTRYED